MNIQTTEWYKKGNVRYERGNQQRDRNTEKENQYKYWNEKHK